MTLPASEPCDAATSEELDHEAAGVEMEAAQTVSTAGPDQSRVKAGLEHQGVSSKAVPAHKIELLAQYQTNGTSPSLDDDGRPAFLTSAQWSADGTTVFTSSSNATISAIVLPEDILSSTQDQPRQLQASGKTTLPGPSQVLAPSPFFSLAEPQTQTYLVGCRDHPIQLYHAFPNADSPPPVGTYKLIKHETEEYITPSSMLWDAPGTHFICGSRDRIDMFDAYQQSGQSPLLTIPTTPSKRLGMKGGGVGMKGTIAALAASPATTTIGSTLAAGTWTRSVGLYDIYRAGAAVANWSVVGADEASFNVDLDGRGVVQTLWSPCGRYLIINERHASGLLVYDVRGTGKLLSILAGRTADSQQRLSCDVFPDGDSGFEVWAGSQDGSLLVWDDAGSKEGICQPTQRWDAHGSPIGSTILHSSGTVAVTCAGGWSRKLDPAMEDPADSDEDLGPGFHSFAESSVKIWAIG